MRSELRRFLLVLLAACSVQAAVGTRPSRRTELPNILLIVADDLRPAELDPGYPRRAETPHLDRLMREGLQFTHAYAGSPAAAAARGSLVTGQHTGRSTVRSGIQEPLAPHDITLAEVVRSVGYRSGMVGQWGLGWEGTTGIPTSQGFNEFLGTLDLLHGSDDRTGFLWRNEVPFEFSAARQARRSDSPLAWLQRGATNVIRINEDAAFFLMFAPHLPGGHPLQPYPKDPLNEQYADPTWTAGERVRAARTARLDQLVGALLADLHHRRLTNDTLILFTSVPGYDVTGKGTTNSTALTGGLRTGGSGLYEGDLRVPLIAWWPGRIRPGVTNLPVAAWDILPTVAEVAGAPIPATASGRSFRNAWTNQESLGSEFYWERHGPASAQAGRIDHWKGILPGPGQDLEVYDLATDPRETTNVASQNPEISAKFRSLFARLARPWAPPVDGAAVAAGRPGLPFPTNQVQGPIKTNFFPVKAGP
jgi:arylsulfatase A-like enzyme